MRFIYRKSSLWEENATKIVACSIRGLTIPVAFNTVLIKEIL